MQHLWANGAMYSVTGSEWSSMWVSVANKPERRHGDQRDRVIICIFTCLDGQWGRFGWVTEVWPKPDHWSTRVPEL